MSERALVTGACGFIGSHMVDRLLEKGYEVVAADRPGLSLNGSKERVKFVPIDVTKPQTLEALNKFHLDKVFHIAAIFDYTASWELLHRVNCEGTVNLLKALSKQKTNLKSIVVWSSGSVYGRSFRKEPLKETELPQPINFYEKSKLLQEQLALKAFATEGLPIVVVRPPAVYGPRSRYGLAVPVFMIKKGLIRFIPGKGDAIGGFMHVEDVVGAAEFLSSQTKAVGEVFNFSDDSKMTIEEAIFLVGSLVNTKIFPVHIPMGLVRAAAFIDQKISQLLKKRPTFERDLIEYMDRDFWMDNAKLKNFGYTFKYPTLRDGLPPTIEWYKEHKWI